MVVDYILRMIGNLFSVSASEWYNCVQGNMQQVSDSSFHHREAWKSPVR